MSSSTCPRCGARYRDDHTCEDIASLDALVKATENNTDRLDTIADKLDLIIALLRHGDGSRKP